MNQRNHPNHATLSHVQRGFIPNDHENVEDEDVEAVKEGQEEGCLEDPDVEVENIKM